MTKKKTILYQTATLSCSRQKMSDHFFQSVSPIQSSTSEAGNSLDMELFIELVWQFPKLKRFKDHKKNKNFWNQINTAPGGSFSSIEIWGIVDIYINILITFIFFDRVRNGNWLYFSTQYFSLKKLAYTNILTKWKTNFIPKNVVMKCRIKHCKNL